MSEKIRKYRLFALVYSLENVNYASSFRFTRVTPEYILVYTQRSRIKPPVGRVAEVKENDIALLSKMDEAWLFDCGISLFADFATRQKAEDTERLTEMINRLEEELEAESRKEGEET